MTYGSVYDGMHFLLYSDGVNVKDLGMTVEELNSKIAMQSQAEEEKLENETTAPETTTPETTAPETTSTLISEDGYITIDADLKPTLLGDADCDGERDISDVVLLSKGILGNATISEQGKVNCDLDKSSDEDINTLNAKDTVVLMNLLIHRIPSSDLPLTK